MLSRISLEVGVADVRSGAQDRGGNSRGYGPQSGPYGLAWDRFAAGDVFKGLAGADQVAVRPFVVEDQRERL